MRANGARRSPTSRAAASTSPREPAAASAPPRPQPPTRRARRTPSSDAGAEGRRPVGRRAADPRLRRAVGVAGGRTARGPRPRVARRDPRATRPSTAAATRSWARSRSSADRGVEPAGDGRRHPARRRARRARCAPSSAAMRGGALWLEREAWPEPLADTYDALLTRDDALLLVGSIDDAVVGFARGRGRAAALRRPPRCDHRPVRGARGTRGRAWARRWSTRWSSTAAPPAASASTPTALPGHRAAKNFFETHGFTARALAMHQHLAPRHAPT